MKKYKIAVLDDYQNVALRAPNGRCFAIERTSPYSTLSRCLRLTPSGRWTTYCNAHIGYVSHRLYKTFYEDTVSNIRKWLDTLRHA